MGVFDSFQRRNPVGMGRGASAFEPNPLEAYDIQEPVERMVAAQKVLDEKARAFLERFKKDEVFDGILDPDAEWRCWVARDSRNSLLFFDDRLEVFGNAAYDHFVDHYSAEWKALAREQAEIDKMGKSLDEYQILKTSLYNVFNNQHRLPEREYFTQVQSRARDYHMELKQNLQKGFDFEVMFQPLREVNRGNPYLNYKLHLAYNPDHKREGYVYSLQSMEAVSADKMYSGPVDLPILGSYAKFARAANERFLEETHSLFYHEALKAHRADVKREYGIPADYFEGTYIDTKKLVDFSDKSFRYRDSKIYLPKSQVALAGDTLYMKRWLYWRHKAEIEKINARDRQKELGSLGDQVKKAEAEAVGKASSQKTMEGQIEL